MPALSIFAIAFIIVTLAFPAKPAKATAGAERSDSKEDAGDLMAQALEKYLKEKKK